MSSVAVGQGSSATPLSNGNGAIQVVHFDATVRRKEKMRQKAVQSDAAPAVVAVEATAPAAPVAPAPVAAPVAPAPVAPVQVAAPVQTAAPVQPVAAAPAPAAPAAPQAAASPALSPAELEAFLVNFVVEQTGYPPEMVELDADLEADLGIDSIKKAQLFGEMAEQINVQIEINEEMSLDDFPTLRHVMDALAKATPNAAPQAAAPAPAPAAAPAPVAPAPAAAQAVPPVQLAPTAVQPAAAQPVQVQPVAQAAPAPVPAAPAPVAQAVPAAAPAAGEKQSLDTLSAEELEKFLVNFVVEQTGYPPEMVELDADLEADLGIDSIKKAQMLGELAEQVNVQIQITDDMSLDDLPTLRDIVDLIVNGRN